MPLPESFLSHLDEQGYNSRSDKHSNALALAVVGDLLRSCAPMRDKARRGELVYDLNRTIYRGTSDWNVDLVLGAPPPGATSPSVEDIIRTPPSTIEIGIEIKATMTAHRKAIRNRKRDFEAHHEHLHSYSGRAIAGGILLVNAAERFQSSLLAAISAHRQPDRLVRLCVDQMRAVPMRRGIEGVGMEALAVVVVEYSNEPGAKARYPASGAAPRIGDPLHYDAFLQAICGHYRDRFA